MSIRSGKKQQEEAEQQKPFLVEIMSPYTLQHMLTDNDIPFDNWFSYVLVRRQVMEHVLTIVMKITPLEGNTRMGFLHGTNRTTPTSSLDNQECHHASAKDGDHTYLRSPWSMFVVSSTNSAVQ